jgi:maltose-binding protein MalE
LPSDPEAFLTTIHQAPREEVMKAKILLLIATASVLAACGPSNTSASSTIKPSASSGSTATASAPLTQAAPKATTQLTIAGAVSGQMNVTTTTCGNTGDTHGLEVQGTVGGSPYDVFVLGDSSGPANVEFFANGTETFGSAGAAGITNFSLTTGATLNVTLTATGLGGPSSSSLNINGTIACP